MKRFLSGILCGVILINMGTVSLAKDVDSYKVEPVIEEYKLPDMENATEAPPLDDNDKTVILKTSSSKSYTIPGGKGILTTNAWRSSWGERTGNSYSWDYQVSAEYSGNYSVSKIRTTWKGTASMRNSGSFSLGVGNDVVSASASSSWQTLKTVSKYWENSNGAKTSSYRSNMIATPAIDYRTGTVAITNTATVYLKGDPKPYSKTASC